MLIRILITVSIHNLFALFISHLMPLLPHLLILITSYSNFSASSIYQPSISLIPILYHLIYQMYPSQIILHSKSLIVIDVFHLYSLNIKLEMFLLVMIQIID